MDEVVCLMQFSGRPGIPLRAGLFDLSVATGPPPAIMTSGHGNDYGKDLLRQHYALHH